MLSIELQEGTVTRELGLLYKCSLEEKISHCKHLIVRQGGNESQWLKTEVQ